MIKDKISGKEKGSMGLKIGGGMHGMECIHYCC